MVKNTKGGNKTKRLKNKTTLRPLIISNDIVGGAMYGLIIGNLGNGRCNITIIDEKGIVKENVQGYIRGNVRRCKFEKDDLVLCSTREFNKTIELNEVDIIHKYTPDQKHILQDMNEIKIINSISLIDNIEFIKDDNLLFQDDESENSNREDNEEQSDKEDESSTTENEDSEKNEEIYREKLSKSEIKKLNSMSNSKNKEAIKLIRNKYFNEINEIDINSI
jgi:hypothetical protein